MLKLKNDSLKGLVVEKNLDTGVNDKLFVKHLQTSLDKVIERFESNKLTRLLHFNGSAVSNPLSALYAAERSVFVRVSSFLFLSHFRIMH